MKNHFDHSKRYRNIGTQDVFTGQQADNLIELANPTMQAIILLSMVETDEPASAPKEKYGPVAGVLAKGAKK
jgi:hypothetical protein